MFGYVTIAAHALEKPRQDRYRSMYCGLCHHLHKRFGAVGQLTLSYDAVFLYILLSSLYEPQEQTRTARCLPHPVKKHSYVQNDLADYCSDMNIALAYHKCLDDWNDECSIMAHAQVRLLQKGYEQVTKRRPQKCKAIEVCLQKLSQLEKSEFVSLDAAVNLSAELFGIVFRFREDHWADSLEHMGQCLGRFVYLMDAYEDLPADIRKKRFNVLRNFQSNDDYEIFIKDSLTMLIGECANIFETLPLLQDADILRNILYAGCWMRYEQLQQKRNGASTPKASVRKEDGM